MPDGVAARSPAAVIWGGKRLPRKAALHRGAGHFHVQLAQGIACVAHADRQIGGLLQLDRLVYRMLRMNEPSEASLPTRERLIAAMLHMLPRKGYHGVGLAELLAHAQAPKGVLYHHFPGGKSALAVAAIDAVVVQLVASLDALMALHTDPVDALAVWMGAAQKRLANSQYERGCPLATIALETTPDDVDIRRALAHGFTAIREHLALKLLAAGLAAEPAREMAALMVSAYEGALLQARVAEHTESMQRTVQALLPWLRLSLQAAAVSLPSKKDTP